MTWHDPRKREGRPPVLGLDVGHVLAEGLLGDEQVRPVEGALDAAAELVEAFDGRAHIISKAGPRVEELTRRWFADADVLQRLGIGAAAVHFVREQVGKAAVCGDVAVTHMIDDRVSVLRHLGGVPFRFLFGHRQLRPGIKAGDAEASFWPTATWADARRAVLQTLHPSVSSLLPRGIDVRPMSVGEAREGQWEFLPTAVVSLADKQRNVVETSLEQLVLFFEDVHGGDAAIRPVHVHRLLDFVRMLDDHDRLLVHCMGGIGRSPAVALGLLVATGTSPDEAASRLAELRPRARPNERVLTVFEDVLGIEGRLTTAAAKILS